MPNMNDLAKRSRDSEVDEAILNALLKGKRSQAMLFHIRHNGGTPQEAWYAIKDLAEIPNYERPSHDPHVDRVERYLHGRDTASSVKWNMAMLCVVAVGMLICARGWPRMSDGVQSYWWPESSAIVTNVRYYATSYWAQQRKVVRRFVDYQYEYEIDGSEYNATIIKQSYVEMFDGPRLKRGDSIRILFDDQNPMKSIHQRNMYQRALPVMIGVIVMLPPTGLLALSLFFEVTHRELEKCDPLRLAEEERSERIRIQS